MSLLEHASASAPNDLAAAQPLATVYWVDRNHLSANNYNPNHVATPEMELLRTSILEDGWTQPIVVRETGEIVDGFHRWTLSGTPEIAALTGGYVPVVILQVADSDPAHQMMSTIRHNRARGSHHVLKMADIVDALADQFDLEVQEIMERLGMEWDEVDRLRERGNMRKRGRAEGFGQAWVPGKGNDKSE